MSTHRVFIANGVFPRFSSTPTKYRDFSARSGRIARLVRAADADCATFGEMGKRECLRLAEDMDGWQYDRAQGTSSHEGLNSCWSETRTFEQPEGRISDYNMPSAGQWQRTLILCRLIEKADPTAFVGLTCGHETLGNAAGLAYIKAMVDKIGDRRALVGMDFKRTQDDDDLAYVKAHKFKVWGRTEATPMVCLTKGAVRVLDVDRISDTRAFDHTALVVTFSIGKADPA